MTVDQAMDKTDQLRQDNTMAERIQIDHISQTERYVFYRYVIEVSPWADAGQSEYWGSQSETDASQTLERETRNCRGWAMECIDDPDPEWYPEIAAIYIRPPADEDGVPDLSYWDTL